MKLPLSWLKAYVDFDDTPEGLRSKLTFSGLEVEAVETIGADLPGVVVGEVRAVAPHPNADRLRLCTVWDGAAEHPVVCGAPNVETGGRYPFAPVGTELPGGLRIKKARIRGEMSLGMLCAEDELGLGEGHEGLYVLDAALDAGTPISEVLGPPEVVFEIEVTPNRPDCLSMLGIAREVAALYGKPLKAPATDLRASAGPVADLARVEVEAPDLCPRYIARVIEGVAAGPSPDWMQRRLTLAGVRPINNLVDITNYVMLELGQPLHAFDLDRLAGPAIIVRRARPAETMATLDGQTRELSPDMLVIADAERPVAVAGVMGGADSEIADTTTRVLLESATFHAESIRATSRALRLSTESSYRFERGVDRETAEAASRRAAALMVDLAGGRLAEGSLDAQAPAPAPRTLTLRVQKARDLTGMDISAAEIQDIFRRLELRVDRADDASCTVTVPAFRSDLEREVDLIEEVARIHGLDQVPSPPPEVRVVPDADDRPFWHRVKLREALCGLGFREIMNYSLLSERLLADTAEGGREDWAALPNPISQDQSILRPSLRPQMIESLGRNQAYQNREAALFELGRVFRRDGGGAAETERLAIGLMGRRVPEDPGEAFLAIKGVWERLASHLHVEGWSVEPLGADPAWRAGHAARIVGGGGAEVGRLGLVHPKVARAWRILGPLPVAELEVAPLLERAFGSPMYRPFSTFPGVERDVALVVAESVRHADVLAAIAEAAPPELSGVDLFDIYRGVEIGNGRKSLAYALWYRSPDRSLTDDETNRMHDRVKSVLRQRLDAEIRED